MIKELPPVDVAVVGAGLAGLCAAVHAAGAGCSVALLSKRGMPASVHVTGFNAPVASDDSAADFMEDIVQSGFGLADAKLARVLAQDAVKAADDAEAMGFRPDTDANGNYDLIRVLGSRRPRLVHKGSETGEELLKLLGAAAKAATRYQGMTVLDIVTENGGAAGVTALDPHGVPCVLAAKAVILATGGSGDIYPVTTYFAGLAGDGYAMAYRAGATLIDMEFQQFEPCCMLAPAGLRGKLLPTTLLFKGGRLLGADCRNILTEYDGLQKSDVALIMAREIGRGAGTSPRGVYLDLRSVARDILLRENAVFVKPLIEAGIDPGKELLHVAPAAHTCLGGVKIDENAATTVPGLFAAGEAAGGVHGANRMGGCAGTEILVFGKRAGLSAAAYCRTRPEPGARNIKALAGQAFDGYSIYGSTDWTSYQDQIGEIVRDGLGVMRNESDMKKAETELGRLQSRLADEERTPGWYNCDNRLTVALMQTRASIARRESRGVFFRTDHPAPDDAWAARHCAIVRTGGGMHIAPVQ